ncbi:MAG: hypothetical protein D6812_11005 [Deltaproteobacteria bacterium]|nr:MAG: hypothetical protein D6812_11005 [Deltaproteobacteria bacterium]
MWDFEQAILNAPPQDGSASFTSSMGEPLSTPPLTIDATARRRLRAQIELIDSMVEQGPLSKEGKDVPDDMWIAYLSTGLDIASLALFAIPLIGQGVGLGLAAFRLVGSITARAALKFGAKKFATKVAVKQVKRIIKQQARKAILHHTPPRSNIRLLFKKLINREQKAIERELVQGFNKAHGAKFNRPARSLEEIVEVIGKHEPDKLTRVISEVGKKAKKHIARKSTIETLKRQSALAEARVNPSLLTKGKLFIKHPGSLEQAGALFALGAFGTHLLGGGSPGGLSPEQRAVLDANSELTAEDLLREILRTQAVQAGAERLERLQDPSSLQPLPSEAEAPANTALNLLTQLSLSRGQNNPDLGVGTQLFLNTR